MKNNDITRNYILLQVNIMFELHIRHIHIAADYI